MLTAALRVSGSCFREREELRCYSRSVGVHHALSRALVGAPLHKNNIPTLTTYAYTLGERRDSREWLWPLLRL